MSKKKWYVDYQITISAGRVIAADTEEEAKEIAEQMLYDRDKGDGYWEDIVGSMEYDTENWRKKYCEIETYGEAPEELEADNEEE